MKISNNALNFLLAQYRAIFKRAYIKGLASAVILTAGLAVGQAQATDITDANAGTTLASGEVTVNGDDTKLTISGTATTGTNFTWGANVTVTSGATASNYIKGNAGPVNITGDGSLTIAVGENDATTNGLSIIGDSSGTTIQLGAINVSKGTLAISDSGADVSVDAQSINIGTADAEATATNTGLLTISGLTDGKTATLGGTNSNITVYADGQLTATTNSGSVSIQGSALNLKNGSLFLAQAGNDSGDTVTISTDTLSAEAGSAHVIYDDAQAVTEEFTGKTANFAGHLLVGENGTLNINTQAATGSSTDVANQGIVTLASGSNTVVTGTLNVNNGTLYVEDGAKINATAATSKITVNNDGSTTDGTLKISSSTLESLVEGGAKYTSIDSTGVIGATADTETGVASLLQLVGGTIELTDKGQVDLATKYFFSGTAAAGVIGIDSTSGATIQGKSIAISTNLANDASGTTKLTSGSKLNIETTDLSLGSATFDDSATPDLGFTEAKAQNLTVNGQGGDLTLVNKVTLSAVNRSVINGDQVMIEGDSGTIKGNIIVSGGTTGGLIVEHGSYTNEGNITISGGALTVQNSAIEGQYVDTKLELSGDLTINAATNSKISVNGGDTDASGAVTVLDLTGLNKLDLVSGTDSATVEAVSGGVLILEGNQLTELLQNFGGSNSGAKVSVNDGTFQVTGDVELDASQIASGAATDHTFTFDGTNGGTLEVEDTLTLNNTTTLNLGANANVRADSLVLNTANAGTAAVLQSGKYTAVSGLNGNHGITVSGAQLTLGGIEGDGTETPYVALSNGGRIGTALIVSGAGSTVDVAAGNWTASSINVADGTLTIGKVENGVGYNDAQGNAITAGLTLDSLNATSQVNVTKVGTLTVNSLTAATGALDVQGKATINGDYTAATDPDGEANFGINLAAGSVTVGQGANVYLGEDAVRAITVGDTKDETDGYITFATDTFGKKVFTVAAGGEVEFAFGEDVTFNADTIAEFRDDLFDYDTTKGVIDGFINLGAAKIDGLAVDEKTNTVDWGVLKGYTDILADVTTQDLAQAKVTNIENNANVRGNLGSLTTVDNYASDTILVDGNLTLNNAAGNEGNFATNANGEVLGLEVTEQATVRLNNGGNIGTISFSESGSNLIVDSANGTTNIAAIDGSEATAAFTTGTAVVAGTTDVAQLTTEAGTTTTFRGAVTVGEDATGNATSNIAGTTTFEADATFAQAANLAGTTNFKQNVSFDGVTAIKGETTVTETASFDAATTIANNGVLRAQDVVLTTTSSASPIVFSVGIDTTGTTTNEVGTGYLEVESFTLAGNDLVVDPAYSQATSVAAISGFADGAGSITNAGTVKGRIFVGRNAALDVGSSASIAHMQQFIQNYQRNGSLVEDEVGAVMYLSDQLTVENGGRIILDSQRSSSALLERAKLGATGYGDGTAAADLYLGQNTVLAIGDNILEDGAAIHFDKTGAGIMAEDASATIVLDGDKFLNSRNIVLFTDDDDGVKVLGDNNIRVETLNGVMYFEYEAGSETTGKTLQLDTYKIDTAFRGATDESRDLLLAYASRTANWEEYYADQANQGTSTKEDPKATNTPVERDPLVAGLASRGEAYWDSNTNSIVVTSSAQQAGLTADDFVAEAITDSTGAVTDYEVYRLAHNEFLESVARNTDGRALDSAALQSVFGGSAQAALLAARTSQDAVAGRVGVGASSSALTFADNGQGAGLWVAPVYVSQDSDGFAVENKDYGVDIDLYGVALGGDYTLANGLRLGAFFNVGTGDADGNGQASGVSNDFDYYSLGLYAGYSMGQFSVVGDVSYSVVDSDIDASTSVGTLKSSFDTDNISVGVTGQYELIFGATSITPHLGLRYSSIGIDDYRIETGYADGGNFDSDTLSVFSVPVGVTIAQDFTAGSWQVKPSFDLTLQGNFGDDEIDATTNWDGVANWSSNYTAEFLDNFTYGATVGVAAKNGNFSAGIGLGYTGSENTDEFSATANARFVF